MKYDVGSRPDGRGGSGELQMLSIGTRCAELGETVTLFLTILDHDDLRGALKPDGRGRSWRGDATALQRLLAQDDPA